MIEEGSPRPTSSCERRGEQVSLASLRGRPVVLYFYPRTTRPAAPRRPPASGTPGGVRAAGADVLGVSPDNEASHVKFKEKYELPFTLLADTEHTGRGVRRLGREVYDGKTYMGVERSTFVIEPRATPKVHARVKPDTHDDEVLAALQ